MATGKYRNRVQKNTAVLNAIRKAMPENTRAFVVEMATDMETYYRDNAPRDTGSMAESTYTQLKDGVYMDGKETSLSAVEGIAKGLRPEAQISPSPVPTNDTTAYVKPVVLHYIFNEYGTSRMPARPVMAQARAHAQANLKSRHMAAAVKVVTDGRK